MRKIPFLLLFFAILASNVFSLPLVFKTTKEIKNAGLSDFVELDTSKLRQARISIIYTPTAKSSIDISREDELFRQGNISKNEYDRRVENKKSTAIQSKEYFLYAVEQGEEILIDRTKENNFLIDSLPSKLKIKVSGEGVYKIYIWAE